jgi:NADH-quinone oxidoreductase subunit L
MVGRLFPIFAASAVAMDAVLLIGTITALLAATIAVVQVDIKKVMAYSTISQLGYMMLALGAGGAVGRAAGLFHLTTHAMFKALLFLTAGAVIHAMHHSADPNDLRRMGGLRSRMPITAWTCLVGVLALAGLPPFAGFFSKDAILGAALAAGGRHPLAYLALAVAILVAGITAFYSLRMWLMAFWGEPRSEDAAHAHEAPAWMTGPLLALAAPSLFLGLALHSSGFFGAMFGEAGPEAIDWGLAGFTLLVSLAGFGLAWRMYGRPAETVDPVTRMPAPIYACLANLWGIDAFWNRAGAGGSLALARTLAWFDRNVIDQAMNGLAWAVGLAGAKLRRTTSGQAQTYAATMVTAVLLLLALVIAWESFAAAPAQSAAATPLIAREARR